MKKERKLRYKCVVLDHDDTAVMSSKELHYPAFCEIMEKMRPGSHKYTFEEFMKFCFEPGFSVYLQEKYGFTDAEFDEEFQIWKDYIKDKTPDFYPGFLELVKELQELGAYICVVSHSEKAEIVRHYAENGVKPDLVYGWELPPEQRKPFAYPMEQIMLKLGMKPQ
ncbi:MAG: HAD family hydrolase, partial [Clostridia bacterium]|nr:HAD family hydrolase [Clostridia bacterium]